MVPYFFDKILDFEPKVISISKHEIAYNNKSNYSTTGIMTLSTKDSIFLKRINNDSLKKLNVVYNINQSEAKLNILQSLPIYDIILISVLIKVILGNIN